MEIFDLLNLKKKLVLLKGCAWILQFLMTILIKFVTIKIILINFCKLMISLILIFLFFIYISMNPYWKASKWACIYCIIKKSIVNLRLQNVFPQLSILFFNKYKKILEKNENQLSHPLLSFILLILCQDLNLMQFKVY